MDVQIACPCLGTPHESDTVTLRDRLDFRAVTTIRKAMALVETDDEQVRNAELLATCTEFYMLVGITAWTLRDERGKPLAVSHAAIRERIFTAADVQDVSDAAERLYNPVVLLPLAVRASRSSPPTQTDESTSPPTALPTKRQKPSKPSSITTTRTAGTVTTISSPGGDSSSSPSSVSAA